MSEESTKPGKRPRIPRIPKPLVHSETNSRLNRPTTGKIAVGGSVRVPGTRRGEAIARPRKTPRQRAENPTAQLHSKLTQKTLVSESESAADKTTTTGKSSSILGKIIVYLGVAILVVGVFVAAVGRPLSIWWKQNRDYQAVVNELAQAKQRNEELQTEVTKWRSDSYTASQARSRLGYIYPGETRYSVVDAEGNNGEHNPAFAVKGPPRPWYLVVTDTFEAANQAETPDNKVETTAKN